MEKSVLIPIFYILIATLLQLNAKLFGTNPFGNPQYILKRDNIYVNSYYAPSSEPSSKFNRIF